MFCPNCGTKNPPDAKFCESCGTNLATAAPAAPPAQAAAPPAAPPPPPAVAAAPAYQQQPPPPPPQTQYQQAQYQQPAYAQPSLDAPMSVGGYMLTLFLLGLPIAGFILMLVWAFGSNVNKNKKNLCRAMLIFALIAIVLTILLWASLYSLFVNVLDGLFAEFTYY